MRNIQLSKDERQVVADRRTNYCIEVFLELRRQFALVEAGNYALPIGNIKLSLKEQCL
jgi:hypothetical protein